MLVLVANSFIYLDTETVHIFLVPETGLEPVRSRKTEGF